MARYAGDSAASYTTGPATRDALARAGALGATTGSVVHLPGAPAAAMSAELTGVLAHELTHARQPVGRPRFLLRAHSGAMDADERAAHTVGQQAAAAGTAFSASQSGPAAVVHRSISSLASAGGAAVPPPGSVTPGLVDQLPVGGASGNAVSEARSAGEGFASHATGTDATARGLLAALAAADPSGAAELAGAASSAGAAGAAGSTAAGELAGVGRHEAGAVSSAVAGLGAGTTAAASAARSASDIDVERIIEAVEQRLLRQLERRGGRYAGVF